MVIAVFQAPCIGSDLNTELLCYWHCIAASAPLLSLSSCTIFYKILLARSIVTNTLSTHKLQSHMHKLIELVYCVLMLSRISMSTLTSVYKTPKGIPNSLQVHFLGPLCINCSDHLPQVTTS